MRFYYSSTNWRIPLASLLLKPLFCCLFVGFFLSLSGCASHSKLSKINFAEDYDLSAPIQIKYSSVSSPQGVKLHIHFYSKRFGQNIDIEKIKEYYQFQYAVFKDYKTKSPLLELDSIPYGKIQIKDESSFFFELDIPYQEGLFSAVVHLQVLELTTGNERVFDIPFPFNRNPEAGLYFVNAITDVPISSLHITTTDTVLLKSTSNFLPEKMVMRYYAEPFGAALPPFVTSFVPPRNPPTDESVVEVNTPLVMPQPGLYFFMSDTAKKMGISLLVQAHSFPKLTRVEELVPPLIYITKKDERDKLNASKNPKPLLDQFWMEIGGTRDNSKRIIRNYYEHIETANVFFTNYKEGWRTDRGLILSIFGKPDRVRKFGNKEEWYYAENANFNSVVFTFVRKPTIFTADNFELLRYSEYQDIFYTTVDQWRKGIINK